MPAHTTNQVKEAFRNRRPLATTNLVSTGTSLLSYGYHEIARWVPNHDDTHYTLIIRRNPPKGQRETANGQGPWYSVTTAKHASGVYAYPPSETQLAQQVTPYNQGEMEL